MLRWFLACDAHPLGRIDIGCSASAPGRCWDVRRKRRCGGWTIRIERQSVGEDSACLPGKRGDRGRAAVDNRRFVDGVLWILRSGAFWEDMPARYRYWKSAHKRFGRSASPACGRASSRRCWNAWAKWVVADTAYDSQLIIDLIRGMGAKPVIPCKPVRNRRRRGLDIERYSTRNVIKLKTYRRIATRFDREADHYMAFLHLAAALIWSA
jgi:transposase